MKPIYFFVSICCLFEITLGGRSQCTQPHEVYQTCGTACPKTCANLNSETTFCTLQCVIGCFCEEGYVRDECSGQCVKAEDCPNTLCGENEVFSCCGNKGQRTCKNKNLKDLICDGSLCRPGCVCKEGYVRDKCGDCIKPEDCCNCKVCAKCL